MKYSIVAITLAAAGSAAAQSSAYAQCGGSGFSGSTTCVSGYHCEKTNDYYSQCVPGGGSDPAPVTKQVSSTSQAAAPTSGSSSGKVKYAGVNIAGFDFGCDISGNCPKGWVDPSTTGQNQMNHFVKDDHLNAFRLPVGWQYLVANKLGGTLDSSFFSKYDTLVTNCLNSGAALCIVDLHNYARWNGQIIGSSGGPTTAQFTSIWSQLAAKYASKSKVAFGVMNEPHDLSSVSDWATQVQAAVTAIRKAGATQNMILLPGNDWTHAATLVSDGSAAALSKVTNLDGSTTNLIFDVHQYSDSDGSGTHTTCTTDNVSAFSSLATWLRTNKRQAFLSEAGGSNDQSCLSAVCAMLNTVQKNSDVYLGWTGWAAGSFDSTYELTESPVNGQDQAIVTKCIAGVFNQ